MEYSYDDCSSFVLNNWNQFDHFMATFDSIVYKLNACMSPLKKWSKDKVPKSHQLPQSKLAQLHSLQQQPSVMAQEEVLQLQQEIQIL